MVLGRELTGAGGGLMAEGRILVREQDTSRWARGWFAATAERRHRAEGSRKMRSSGSSTSRGLMTLSDLAERQRAAISVVFILPAYRLT
jgi:hypothetical protein